MEETGGREFNFVTGNLAIPHYLFFSVLKQAEPARDLRRPIKIADELIK